MTLRRKQWLAPGTAIAAAALLAACSTGSTTAPGTSGNSAGASPSATSTADAGLALAQQAVAKLEAVAAGTVDGLGLLKSGSLVKAVVVVDEAYEGWALTDEILRMATKTAPVNETIPTRLFTKQNIGTIQITTADQASGAWFGSTSFEGEFAKLWGVGSVG